MDRDVIGDLDGAQDRARPRWRGLRGVRLPRALTLHRRLVAALVAVAAVAAVVAGLRAGVSGLAPGAQRGPALAGTVLALAGGQSTLYAVASDCSAGCRPMLLASDDDGATWAKLAPPGLPSDPSAIAGWQLAVSGGEDLLTIEDDAAGTVTVGAVDTPFVTRRITAAAAWPRVPAGREVMVRICPAPRCRSPRLDYLEPRTGQRGPLLVQPPLSPRAVGVAGGQIWVAGIDRVTRRYAVAVSLDDAGSWSVVRLAGASIDPALQPQLVPVPEQDTSWLLLGRPGRRGGQVTAAQLWLVPAPDVPLAAHRVRPQDALGALTGAVGLKDGRLGLVDRGLLTVVAQDGVTDRMASSDVESTRYVLRQPQRGPHLLFVAAAVRTDGVAAIATSLSGNPGDWTVRSIVL